MFDVFFIVFDHFVGLVLKKVTHFTRMLENDTKLGNHEAKRDHWKQMC